jgi:hypothetical protein
MLQQLAPRLEVLEIPGFPIPTQPWDAMEHMTALQVGGPTTWVPQHACLLEVQDHVCSGEGGSYCWICILCLLCQFWLSPQDLCTIILGYSVCEEEGVDGYLASVFAGWHTAMHHEATVGVP